MTRRARAVIAAVLVALGGLGGTRLAADPPAGLPPGAGSAIVARVCSQCHSLDTITRAHLSRPQWDARLDEMIGKGARLDDADFDVVADYLARNFGSSPARERPSQ